MSAPVQNKSNGQLRPLSEVADRSLGVLEHSRASDPVVALRAQVESSLKAGCSRETTYQLVERFYDRATLSQVFPEFVTASAGIAPALAREPSFPKARTESLAGIAPDELAFQYVPLIQCSFPHSDVAPAHSFSRRNGRLELTISTSRLELGLPYGTPVRLLTMFVTTEVVRTSSPEIWLGRSLQDFLKRIGVPISRGPRGSVAMYANQLQKLIHTQFSMNETMEDGAGRQGLRFRQTLLFEDGMLWWDKGYVAGRGSTLVLHDAVFQSMLERSAPLQAAAIQALRKSPMDLDVYAWLVHRLYNMARPSRVTWEQLFAQIGHSYSEIRIFKHWFLKSLRRAHREYPEANFAVDEHGLFLRPSRPHVPRKPRLLLRR